MELQLLEGVMDTQIYTLAIALYILGIGLKKANMIKDRHIPIILGAVGVIFVSLFVFSTNELNTFQDICRGIFTGFVQGILCAAASVFANQVFKQWKRGADEKGKTDFIDDEPKDDTIEDTKEEMLKRDNDDESLSGE